MNIAIKRAGWVLAGAGAMALTACVPPGVRHPNHSRFKVVERLDCPDHQGRLVLDKAATDGKSCDYSSGQDIKIQLKLVPVVGDTQATLQPIENELRQLTPVDEEGQASDGEDEAPAPDRPTAAPASGRSADTLAASSSAGDRSRDRDGDHVNINLPGLHIHAGDEKANIQVGGLMIDADDRTDHAHIRGRHWGRGEFSIDAGDGGAIVRSRARGPDVRQTLILASDKPGPEGWRAVGYEAHGPRTGPLVVAVVRSKAEEHDNLFDEVKALVRRNAGR
jgi:hypothetical protein